MHLLLRHIFLLIKNSSIAISKLMSQKIHPLMTNSLDGNVHVSPSPPLSGPRSFRQVLGLSPELPPKSGKSFSWQSDLSLHQCLSPSNEIYLRAFSCERGKTRFYSSMRFSINVYRLGLSKPRILTSLTRHLTLFGSWILEYANYYWTPTIYLKEYSALQIANSRRCTIYAAIR